VKEILVAGGYTKVGKAAEPTSARKPGVIRYLESKAYAVRAAALLSEGTRTWCANALWQAVSNDPEKKPCVSAVGKWNAVETTNGDSPGCTSSKPSPERIDEAFCGESPLEKSIADSEK
jgi:hypothetical protein